MLEVKVSEKVHKIWDSDGPDWNLLSREGGCVYEWAEGSRYVTVWPKGSFEHMPESGHIDLDLIIDDFEPDDFNVDMLVEFLRKHESTPDEDREDYYCPPDGY